MIDDRADQLRLRLDRLDLFEIQIRARAQGVDPAASEARLDENLTFLNELREELMFADLTGAPIPSGSALIALRQSCQAARGAPTSDRTRRDVHRGHSATRPAGL